MYAIVCSLTKVVILGVLFLCFLRHVLLCFDFVLMPLIFNMKLPVLDEVVSLTLQILLVWCSVEDNVTFLYVCCMLRSLVSVRMTEMIKTES